MLNIVSIKQLCVVTIAFWCSKETTHFNFYKHSNFNSPLSNIKNIVIMLSEYHNLLHAVLSDCFEGFIHDLEILITEILFTFVLKKS